MHATGDTHAKPGGNGVRADRFRGGNQVCVSHLVARHLVRMAHPAVGHLARTSHLAFVPRLAAKHLARVPRLATRRLARVSRLVARRLDRVPRLAAGHLIASISHHRQDLLGATMHTKALRILDLLPAQSCKIGAILVKPVEFDGKVDGVCMREDVVLGERVGLR